MYGLFFNALFDLAVAHWFFHLSDSACVTAPILSSMIKMADSCPTYEWIRISNWLSWFMIDVVKEQSLMTEVMIRPRFSSLADI